MSERGPRPGLAAVFRRLRAILGRVEGPLTAKIDRDGRYELWSVKDVVIEGRKKKEAFFAGLIIQSDYAGFYFMPIYADASLASFFAWELLRLLKGKSFFHVKALDARLEKAIASALRKGFALYQKRGWV